MNVLNLKDNILTRMIVFSVLVIGIIAGFFASRSTITLQNLAQSPQPTIEAGGACRLQQAVCSVDPNDLPDNARFRLKILAGGTPVITGQINQPTLAIAQAQQNTQYKCEIEVLNAEGTPYPEQQCSKSVDAEYTCSNCSCKDWGSLLFEPAQSRPNDPAKYFKAVWRGATPPPQCADDTQNCKEVRVFAESPNEPAYDNFISKYSCAQNPVPTIRMHQAEGTGDRAYKAIPFNSNGNPLLACIAEQIFSCADIGRCGLEEISYSGQYIERLETGAEKTVTVTGSECNARLCNFSLQQGGRDIEENSNTCVNLGEPLNISYQSSVSGPKMTFDDDTLGNIWKQLTGKTGLVSHTYNDAGIYEIKLNCDPNVGNVPNEFYCVKRLTIGCEGGGVTPSVTSSPTPTPAACPIPQITLKLPNCTDCSLSPTQ